MATAPFSAITSTGPAGAITRTVRDYPTDYWNDSCAAAELSWGIDHGATGATTNPTIVGDVLKKEIDIWAPRVRAIRAERPDATDQEVTWQVIEEMAIRGWKMLEPVFEREQGRKGRLSIQTNPTYHVSTERMLDQARHFATLAPNVQVKFPVTAAGLAAIEQATYEGISINATVSFTVPQALAVGAAVERALRRREAEGKDVVAHVARVHADDRSARRLGEGRLRSRRHHRRPGRAGLGRHRRVQACRRHLSRTRLSLPARSPPRIRHHLHWSELIGGDIVLTIPYQWARRFEASTIEVRARFDDPVPAGARGAAAGPRAGLPARLGARWADARRVRQLRRHRAHAAVLHRQLLVPGGHGRRAAAAEPGRAAERLRALRARARRSGDRGRSGRMGVSSGS